MVDYICGRISELSPTQVVVENQGVGYRMEISLMTYDALSKVNEAKVFIQNQFNPREGTQVDYAFATKDERELFCLITGVSGIGASSARMILSAMDAESFREAILAENINALKSIKGIGLKSAQRMILELKDKIVKGDGSGMEVLIKSDNSAVIDEATSALSMLGFSKSNINKAIQAIIKKNPSATVEDIIKAALKML